MYCTLNNVPVSADLLKNSRLPFGVHIHPFAYDERIPVSEGIIVRCRTCRAYINPYSRILDQSMWKCNLCGRTNELAPQFIYDYDEQCYYDLSTKIELTNDSIEYIANAEYMNRPPQPACYMFVFECSKKAFDLGFINVMAETIANNLDEIPGDSRALIGFIGFDSCVHYFSFLGSQVHRHVSPDITSDFIPCPRNALLANISKNREILSDFFKQVLPSFVETASTDDRSALGSAVLAATRILKPIGGRITIIYAQLPNTGISNDGSILPLRQSANKPNYSPGKNSEYLTPLLNPASDFYKNIALECSSDHITIDVFNMSTSYADLASISCLAKYSAGSVYHYSNNFAERNNTLDRFRADFTNYLTRPIGFEAVLRLRCSRGLKIHSFHGNFFVRSFDLLTLPNTNPDSSYTLQISIDDDLAFDSRHVYFQAVLLYTTPEGQRRCRVHTTRHQTVTTQAEVIVGANQVAIIGLLAKMGVDKTIQNSIGSAKEALISSCVDLLEVYSPLDPHRMNSYSSNLPENLRHMPLYVLALLKHIAFKSSPTIPLDDRIAAFERFKNLPLDDLMTYVYPDLYPLHGIAHDEANEYQNPLQLTAALLERHGAYLLDAYDVMILYICENIDYQWVRWVFNVPSFAELQEYPESLQVTTVQPSHLQQGYQSNQYKHPSSQTNNISNSNSSNSYNNNNDNDSILPLPLDQTKVLEFINCLIETRSQQPKFYIIKSNSKNKFLFTQYLVDDRTESNHSLVEFTKYLVDQMNL